MKCVVDWLSSVSVTGPGLRVQPVVMPFGDPQSWTLVDRDSAVVEPVEGFLSHLHAVERSPNTVKAYAHDLRDWFEFLDQRGAGVVAGAAGGRGPVRGVAAAAGVGAGGQRGGVADRGERVLGGDGEPEAVGDLGVLRVPSAPRRGSGGSADDLAAARDAWRIVAAVVGALGISTGTQPGGSGLRAERRIPDTLDAEQVAAIVAACDRLRDRFLFTLLAASGLRVGEALGLRHSDIDAAARLVSVVPRVNANRARAKGGGRQVPVPGAVIRLYADYLHGEYGELDSDYVFVNLWSGPIGCPLTYPSVYDLVCRLRERTGIMFGPHTFRHSYATELLRRKVPVEVVAHLLGHASIATTSDAYAHLKVEDARRALVAAGWLADRDGSR